MMISQYHTEAL